MDPAARVRKITLIASLVNCRPTAVPTNVGPPPISPMSRRNPQEGRSPSAASGATMPNPSVPLCSANPMTRTVARPISPAAALPPMASPSPKLCRPMPIAISRDRRRAADHPEIPRVRGTASSSGAIVPGPNLRDDADDADDADDEDDDEDEDKVTARAREPSQPS